MAQSTARRDAAVDFQVVRAFLERSFTIENAIKVLQQDKSALREECKGRGLDMQTMTAAIALAKKRQLVPVSRDTLDALIREGEEKLPAPEASRWTGGGQPEDCFVCTEGSAHGLRTHFSVCDAWEGDSAEEDSQDRRRVRGMPVRHMPVLPRTEARSCPGHKTNACYTA